MARNKERNLRERMPNPADRSDTASVRPAGQPTSQGRRAGTRNASPPALPPWWIRYPVSVLILWHIIGLFVAPMAVSIAMVADRNVHPGGGVISPELQELPAAGATPAPLQTTFQSTNDSAALDAETPPADPLALPTPTVMRVADFYQPYLDALYLNHGYHFFAPDPGPSHVFDYTVERAEGEPISGRFPDLKTHWPRLLYHRHFMLAEQVETIAPTDPDSTEPLGAARAYAQHLLRAHGGNRVYLRWIEHKILTPGQVIAGTPIDADWTYEFNGDLYEPPDSAQGSAGNQNPPEEIAIPTGPNTGRTP